MVVDEPGRLHVRVADGRPDESKAASAQVRAERLRQQRPGGNPGRRPVAGLDRSAADEPPKITLERAFLFLEGEERARVGDRRLDLGPVPDDTRISQEAGPFPPVVAGDPSRVEAVEGGAVARSLPQDRLPRQARLRPLEDQELEELAVIPERNAPLFVVVGDPELGPRPGAAGQLPLVPVVSARIIRSQNSTTS